MADCLSNLDKCVDDLDNCVSDPRSETASRTLYPKAEGASVFIGNISLVGSEQSVSLSGSREFNITFNFSTSSTVSPIVEGALVSTNDNTVTLIAADQSVSLSESTTTS